MDNQMQSFYKNALIGSLCEPLCDEYKAKWRACGDDKERLVALALNQQSCPYVATYCNKGKGVTKEYILHEYKDYINGYTISNADGVDGYTYGLYVDYEPNEDLVVDKDVIHAMWCVGTSMVVPETKCSTIYISNKSNIHLVCGGYNSIRIYLFDTSVLTIEDLSEESDVIVYKYSARCRVDKGKFCLGKVSEFNKELRL